MKLFKNTDQKGFTIIEVMIVLAIAGVIIAAVLIAVPQLQRNQRNSARKSIVGRIKTEVDSYSSNNNGSYPTQDANATSGINGGFKDRYIVTLTTTDPTTGNAMSLNPRAADGDGVAGTEVGTIDYSLNAVCNGEVATTTGASARNYAMTALLEGGATYCVDNK